MKVPVNISNDTLVSEAVRHQLIQPEDIQREGNKLVKPTREELKAMLEALPDEPAANTGDNSVNTGGDNNTDNTSNAGDTSENKQDPPVKVYDQSKQANPNRFYVIPRRLKGIDEKGNRTYEEVPTYFVNGKWCEDEKGAVECSHYDNLIPVVQEEYRKKGIIR